LSCPLLGAFGHIAICRRLCTTPLRQVPFIDVFGFRAYRYSLAGDLSDPGDPDHQASA